MVFELDSDLALSGLVSDKGVLEQLLCRWSAGICLHKAALYKVNEFLGPGMKGGDDKLVRESGGVGRHETGGSWAVKCVESSSSHDQSD